MGFFFRYLHLPRFKSYDIIPSIILFQKATDFMSEVITYMGYQWITVNNGIVTVGINEEGAADLGEEITVHLPEQDDVVMPGKVCGEVETESGNLNLYCPVAGTIVEVNETVIENPTILLEDPVDEGWLFKVEADDPDKIDLVSIRNSSEDDDDDDDDEDEYEDDEEDEDSSRRGRDDD
jgi:glycine cleavage system H protein